MGILGRILTFSQNFPRDLFFNRLYNPRASYKPGMPLFSPMFLDPTGMNYSGTTFMEDWTMQFRSISAALFSALMVFSLVSAPTSPAMGEGAQLRSIGSLGASHIYTTYGYIGVLADAYVKDVYTAEKVQELMAEVSGIVDANIKHLEEVKKEGLTPSDEESVQEMIDIYKLLSAQANSLSQFATTKDAAHAKEFERVRTTVWPKISRLLGIEPQ